MAATSLDRLLGRVGVSTTSLAISTGIKVFTLLPVAYFAPLSWVTIESDANPGVDNMFGRVLSCIAGILTVDVLSVGGSGTRTDWTIRPSSARGEPGPPGGLYSSTAEGLSKTSSGDLFEVQAAGDTFTTLYKNVSGVAVSQGLSLASKSYSDKILNNLEGHQTIGRPFGVAAVDGSSIGANVYVPMQGATRDGYVRGFRYFGRGTGTGFIRVCTAVGDVLTIVKSIPVSIVPGAQTAAVEIPVGAGQFVGLYGSGLVAYTTSGYPDEIGFWRLTGDVTTSGTATPVTGSGIRLQFAFDIAYQSINAADIRASLDKLRAGVEMIQTIGRPRSTPLVTGPEITAFTNVRGDLALYDGRVRKLRYFGLVVGTMYWGVFSISGDTKTTTRWYPVQVALGENSVDVDVPIQAGQAVGFYAYGGSLGLIASVAETADGVGYWAASGRVASFDDATLATTNRAQISFEIAYVLPAGGVVANQFEEGNDPDNASAVSTTGSAAIVDITNPILTAMGFARGVKGDSSAAYGSELKQRTVGGEGIFIRGYFETNTAGNFGTPQLYLSTDDTRLATIDISVEKTLSDTVRIYSGFIRNPVAGADRYSIGTAISGSPGVEVMACGLQFAIQRTGQPGWIERGDYFKDSDQLLPVPVIGGDLWLIEGRNPKLYLENMIPFDIPKSDALMSISFPRDDADEPYSVTTDRRGGIELDVSKIVDGSTASLRIWPGNRRFSKPYVKALSCHVKSASGLSGSPVMNANGASGTNRKLLFDVNAKLQARGVTPIWAGTIKTTSLNGGSNANTTGGVFAEARESRSWAELIGKDTSRSGYPVPLPVGQEAAYLAMSKTNKRLYNPYLRVATGGDDPAKVFQYLGVGYTFDYGFYIARFAGLTNGTNGHVVPTTHFMGLLGGNDSSYYTVPEILANVAQAVPIVCASVLAFDPSMKIGIGTLMPAFSRYGFADRRGWTAMCKADVDAVEAFDHPNVTIIPMWVHTSPYDDFEVDGSGTIIDSRHPWGTPQSQAAEAIAAWIVNTL